MGCDPTYSNLAADKIVSNIGTVAQDQLLPPLTTGPDCTSSHIALSMHSSTQVIWRTQMPGFPLHISENIILTELKTAWIFLSKIAANWITATLNLKD